MVCTALVGRARANGMALLGDDLSAKQAKEWGLIWDCYTEDLLMTETMKIAQRLAERLDKQLKSLS
ncbi:MAG: hypothetical protein CMQ40_07760 [Gammaproteobacteria bacterium]|nr:hypothetical protein [Gammaproteobacteria bacterium]